MKNRRQVLGVLGFTGAAVALTSRAWAQDACYDPAALSLSQRNARRSLGYVEVSGDATKHCSLCAYFTASAKNCGNCQLLLGAPVNGGGVCSSFAAKG
ncbi:high-potential iron-sulfur protein [Novosphingobium sp. ST904]|uniref:high-potential iron-sulfur protein n=1 Tax=Novosphingobium sp. ST904 TaxID=1684385 RepID=UPI0009E6840B|nr:high potential iron-sulfur protein [Novosphingobium sp. ST904]